MQNKIGACPQFFIDKVIHISYFIFGSSLDIVVLLLGLRKWEKGSAVFLCLN